MLQINTITNSPYQTMTLQLENGQPLSFTIWYSYTQQGWYYTFNYQGYIINNRRIVNSINMIRQIRNVVPFGLACLLTDAYEPVFITDFSSGRATLYTLNETDVATVETTLTQLQLINMP